MSRLPYTQRIAMPYVTHVAPESRGGVSVRVDGRCFCSSEPRSFEPRISPRVRVQRATDRLGCLEWRRLWDELPARALPDPFHESSTLLEGPIVQSIPRSGGLMSQHGMASIAAGTVRRRGTRAETPFPPPLARALHLIVGKLQEDAEVDRQGQEGFVARDSLVDPYD